VIEALGSAGYAPDKDDEIGYFYVPWQPLEPNVAACVRMLEENRIEDERPSSEWNSGIQPARNDSKGPDASGMLVPYEWCEPSDFGARKSPVLHVLVLWLVDDAFRDAPLARLADLTSWFRLKSFSASQTENFLPLPAFRVLGPDNSGTLNAMVMEAKDDPWNNETRECLATTHIYSSQAAAAESRLLSAIPAMDGLRIPFMRDCKDLIERNVRLLQSNNGFCFDRTLLPDDLIVETLWKELECRGLKTDDHVAIISEQDTYCARALCSIFTNSKPKTISALNLHSFTYLRGIDGKLPSKGNDEKETKGAAESGDKNTQSSVLPKEQTEGLNQTDDIRRLATHLQQLDKTLRQNSDGRESLKAVGLLGSDVYDKLELLRALRPLLPEASFFTNNLDARFAHPDEWNETHNLVVVSGFRLSLQQYENVPPFRDSGQTALFAATLEAMDQLHTGDPAIPRSPLIFEIGRKGPQELSIPASERATIAELSAELAHFFRPYLPRIASLISFIAILVSLLVWTRLVTRVAPASEGEVEAEDLVIKELISK